MTLEELAGMLEKTGFPFAYDHFAEGESPDPPFICYLLPGSDNFAADGRVYFRISEVRISELIELAEKASSDSKWMIHFGL